MGAGGSNNVTVNTYSLEQKTSAQTCAPVRGFPPPSCTSSQNETLNFASVPTTVVQGMGVQDVTSGHTTYIPTGTTVTATSATTVTLSTGVTTTIPINDEIQFAYSFAGSKVLYFPSSASSSLATVKAGMGVADAAPGNSTVILPGTTVASVSTTAYTVTINAGEGGIVTNSNGTDGVQPGDQIVFSPVGNCTSQDNPTPTDLVSIFKAIAASLSYTQLLPLTCISGGANTC